MADVRHKNHRGEVDPTVAGGVVDAEILGPIPGDGQLTMHRARFENVETFQHFAGSRRRDSGPDRPVLRLHPRNRNGFPGK